MDETPEQPQIYLITPAEIELSSFPAQLAATLDAHDVACVRLALSTRDEDRLSRAADALREVTHARDVALVISDHVLMVERLGLDGVHLSDAAKSVRYARKELGEDAIVGSYCGTSRHGGMSAGEAGADYVCFGPAPIGTPHRFFRHWRRNMATRKPHSSPWRPYQGVQLNGVTRNTRSITQ